MGKYPSYFPDNFANEILPKTAEFKENVCYRVAKYGLDHPYSYLGSLGECLINPDFCAYQKEKGKYNPQDASFLATSCHTDFGRAKQFASIFMRKQYPPLKIGYGTTNPECGPSLQDSPNHISWWLYECVAPWLYFLDAEGVESNEK